MKIAAVQMCSGSQPEPNLSAIEAAVADAAGQGAEYILTPEMSIVFAGNREGLAAVAEPWDGNTAIARCSALAAKHRVALHIGSLAIALGDGTFANRSVLFAPDGSVAATYDKIHMFDADLPDRAYREGATYRGGNTATVVPIAGFTLGLTVCYDVRFPALYTALATAGAEVIAVPSAFTVPTGEAHWEVLLRARAIETGCYVIAAAQGGTHENGRETYGHSMIVDPWGVVLASVYSNDKQILVVDIDRDLVARTRARVPALANVRPFSLSVNEAGAS
jgi:deaminated glutathione amidase